jgi:hypothetical protein
MTEQAGLLEALAACKKRLRATAERITKVLVEDVAEYPDRELRRRFLSDDERAASISDAALKKLRKKTGVAGRELSAGLADKLGQDGTWQVVDGAPSETRDLRQVASVWATLSDVDATVDALASEHGLGGDDRQPPGYAPPARFIEGNHLPTLVEALARDMSELGALEKQANQTAVTARKNSLGHRWEKAKA